MINLLSPIEKKKILKEYYLRIGVLVAIGFFILEIATFGMLVPSYMSIASSVSALREELAQKKSSVPPGDEAAENDLSDIKKKIALLQPPTSPTDIPVASVIDMIFKEKPRGVDISAFTSGHSGKDTLIQIGGFAQTREDLIAFQRALEKPESRFTDVRYAENFLTKKVDINFQLTLKLKQ